MTHTSQLRATVQPFVDLLAEQLTKAESSAVWGTGDPHVWSWGFSGQWRANLPSIDVLDVVIWSDHGTSSRIDLPSAVAFQYVNRKSATGLMHIDAYSLPVRFLFATYEELGALMMWLTGPKELWEAQQKLAKGKGYELLPVGLFQDGVWVAGSSEQEIYSTLGMSWITPERRKVFAAPTKQELITRQVLSSKGDKHYTVKIRGTLASCTCLGFAHRRMCRHVKEVRLELGIEGPITYDSAFVAEGI